MIFEKPKDIRYVDMAKYIDDNVYSEKKDEALIYEYTYHLCRMIAKRRNMFRTVAEYDDFALYFAGYMMHRYNNKKQHRTHNRMPKVKSVLNYIKAVANPVKVRYQNDNYPSGKIDIESIDLSNVHNFRETIINSSRGVKTQEFDLYISDIPKVIYEHVKKTPYTGVELKNIYISCVLTIMNGMTLTNTQKKKLESVKRCSDIYDYIEDKLYAKEREAVILYHIDEMMEGYIKVLCSRIRNIIIEDLNYLMTSWFGEGEIRDMLVDCVENI